MQRKTYLTTMQTHERDEIMNKGFHDLLWCVWCVVCATVKVPFLVSVFLSFTTLFMGASDSINGFS